MRPSTVEPRNPVLGWGWTVVATDGAYVGVRLGGRGMAYGSILGVFFRMERGRGISTSVSDSSQHDHREDLPRQWGSLSGGGVRGRGCGAAPSAAGGRIRTASRL